MRKLYEIEADLSALDDVLATVPDLTSEGNMEAIEFIRQWEEQLAGESEAKVDAYCCIIKNCEAMVEARKSEANRMRELASRDERTAEWLRARLEEFLRRRQTNKIETAKFKVGIQKNGGKAPLAVDATKMGLWPADCRRETIEPERDAIRARLEAGECVPGCELLPRGESLRIR